MNRTGRHKRPDGPTEKDSRGPLAAAGSLVRHLVERLGRIWPQRQSAYFECRGSAKQKDSNGNEEGLQRQGEGVVGKDPLPRLRTIREQIRRTETLYPERDRLIREAAEQGFTQEQIAKAAGLSQPRINQILISS